MREGEEGMKAGGWEGRRKECKKEGEKKGRKGGKKEGRDEGRKEGRKEGGKKIRKEKGRKGRKKEGREERRKEGRKEGSRYTITYFWRTMTPYDALNTEGVVLIPWFLMNVHALTYVAY